MDILQTAITQETPIYTWELPTASENAVIQDWRFSIIEVDMYERLDDKPRTLVKYSNFSILGNEKIKGKKAKYDYLAFAIPIPATRPAPVE
jgi:hypothetical protein